MALTWERNTYPGELSIAEREEWFDDALGDFFVTSDNTDDNNGTIYLGTHTYLNVYCRTSIRFRNMAKAYSDSAKPYIYTSFAFGNDSNIWGTEYDNDWARASGNASLMFDKAEIKNGTLVHIHYDSEENTGMLYAFTNGKTLDGTDDHFLFCTGQNRADKKTDGKYFFAGKKSSNNALTYSSNNTNTYMESDNFGATSLYIMRPWIYKGLNTGLYTIDGGEARLARGTLFAVDGHSFYSLGVGVAAMID